MNEHEARSRNEEEEDAEDDSFQVVVCGTSEEGNLIDFAREHGIGVGTHTRGGAPEGGGGTVMNKRLKKGPPAGAAGQLGLSSSSFASVKKFSSLAPSSPGYMQHNQLLPPSEFADREAAVEYMTQNKKVVLEWELTSYPPPSSSSSSSSTLCPPSWRTAPPKNRYAWFNYGLDEHSFKDWIQRQLDERLVRLERHKISNIDDDESNDTSTYINQSTLHRYNYSHKNASSRAGGYYSSNTNSRYTDYEEKRSEYNSSMNNNNNYYYRASASNHKNDKNIQRNVSHSTSNLPPHFHANTSFISPQRMYSHVASDSYAISIQKSSSGLDGKNNLTNVDSQSTYVHDAAPVSSDSTYSNVCTKDEVERENKKEEKNEEKEDKADKEEKKESLDAPKLDEAVFMKLKGLSNFLKNL